MRVLAANEKAKERGINNIPEREGLTNDMYAFMPNLDVTKIHTNGTRRAIIGYL